MNSKRAFFVMIGLVVLLSIGSVGSAVWGNKALKQRAQKLVDIKLENRILDEQQVSLAQATKDIEKYKDLQKIAKSIVPQDKDQASAVREIVKIANETGIRLSSITFPASTLGQTAPKVSNEEGEGSQPTTPPVTQVKPVEGISGVFVMEINIQQDANSPVTFDRFISFLDRLEQNRRTAHVTGVTVQPNSQNRSLLTFNLVVNIYIKP